LIKLLKNDEEIEVAAIKTSMVCFDYKERKVRSIPDGLRKILEQCTVQEK
jgi:acyl-CoA thioesterase FadM